MKHILKRIFVFSLYRKVLLRFFIFFHNACYKAITVLAIADNNGTHPKHDILNYHAFFLSHLTPEDVIIDIGCGKGENAYDLAQKAKSVVGIDIKQGNIDVATKKYTRENLTYVTGDATTYQFDQQFSAIVLSNVLEHIEDRVTFLKDMKRLSHTILLRVPMVDRDWLTVYKKNKGFEYRLDPTHYIEYTGDTLFNELNNAGWKLAEYSIQYGELWGVVRTNIV